MHELKLYEVQKKYKDKTAVKQVSYTFKHGVYGLLGENGAGKTTLMRLICGVLQPTTGNIYYDGMEIAQMGAEYRRLLGYLPQELGYYDNFTAERFLRYIAALKAMSAECSEQRIQELLELVELQKDKKKKLRTFSGGMLRRVGIAQALLNNPEILVLDEPTAGLDPKGRDEILQQIKKLQTETGLPILLVSHSMEDVAEYVDRIIVMNKILIMKDGELICSGTEQGITASVKGYVWKCNVSTDVAQKLCNQYMVSNLRNGSEENQAELRIISEKCPFPAAELAEETLEDAYLYQTQDINRIRSRRDENTVV